MSVEVILGDCLDVLRGMAEASVDSVVCDPPYGLEFMGREWDAPWQVSSKSKLFGDRERPMPGWGVTRNANCRACGGRLRGAKKCQCGRPEWDEAPEATRTRQMRAFQDWCEAWAREVYRVMKPGAHLVAFGGTRTYHRLACAIEDAGFEVRDQLAWITGQGFPKSLNVSKVLHAEIACCCHKGSLQSHHASEAHRTIPDEGVRHLPGRLAAGEQVSAHPQPDVLAGVLGGAHLGVEKGALAGAPGDPVRNLRDARASAGVSPEEADTGVLLGLVPERDVRGAVPGHCPQGGRGQDAGELREGCHEGQQEPGLERRGDVPQPEGQLRLGSLREVPAGASEHGPNGRVRDGAPAGDGAVDRQATPAGRVRASRGSRPSKQPSIEPDALAGQPQSQDGRAWPCCGRCGKPIVPDGLGTALKPAWEPIVLARKPLAEGTVAANVLEHGTGALNIAASRVKPEGQPPVEPAYRRLYALCSAACSLDLSDERARDLLRHISSALRSGSTGGIGRGHGAGGQDGIRLAPAECERVRDRLAPNGASYVLSATAVPGSLAGCPSCRCSCDALSRTAIEAAQVSAPSLADALDGIALGRPEASRSHDCQCSGPIASLARFLWLQVMPEYTTYSAPPESTKRRNHGGTGNPENWRTGNGGDFTSGSDAGRWPANLCHDGSPEVLEAFGRFGERKDGVAVRHRSGGKNCHSEQLKPAMPDMGYGARGTAARFFPALGFGEDELRFMYSAKAGKADRCGSVHPTVKPVALMRWLCRLVTPPGGTVLDPFAGSGTTGEAALREGFAAVLIEREAEYHADILARLARHRAEAPLLAEVAA